MKIYFVKLRPGYWESFVTTDAGNAQLKLLENPDYVLEETELKEIDFEPENATYIGMLGSCAADLKFLKPENRLCFLPVYNKDYNLSFFEGLFYCVHDNLIGDVYSHENPAEACALAYMDK